MKKIAICGTHGSGKTHMINAMSRLFRKYNKSVYVIEEVVRKHDYPINLDATVRGQRQIWNEQFKEELKAHSLNCDIVLCDRSLMDSLVYYRYLLNHQGIEDKIFDKLKEMTKIWMSTYDEIIFLPVNFDLLENDGKRIDDVNFALAIDELMEDEFLPYSTIITVDAREFNVPGFVKLFLQENNLIKSN